MKKYVKMIISAILICSAVMSMYFVGKTKGYRNGRKDEEDMNKSSGITEPDESGENGA